MNNYDFLKKSPTNISPTIQRDYSFLEKKDPEILDTRKAKTVRLPLHLGGGEYMISETGGLFTSERSQDPIGQAKPGQERDHIVPVSLGGASTRTNLQYLESKPSVGQKIGSLFGKDTTVQQSPKRQEGKLETELEAIRAYKAGDITLDQARLKIATKQQQLLGLTPSEREQTTMGQLWNGIKDTAKYVKTNILSPFLTDMTVAAVGSLDFVHRTGLHAVSGIGVYTSTGFVSAMKILGDDSLKDIDYDEIWAQELEAGEKRALDIGRPDEYFRSKVTGTEYVPMNLFIDEAKEQAQRFHANVEAGDNWGATKNIANLAALGFMRDMANPFYLFSIKGVKEGSFKLDTKGKLVGKMEINPAKKGFLIAMLRLYLHTHTGRRQQLKRLPCTFGLFPSQSTP